MEIHIKKVKIKIEYSFILIIAFSLLLDNRSVIFILLFSSLHETAHITALLLFKGRIKEINIAFYGVGLKYDYSFLFILELIFLLSGVLVNFVLALIGLKREINLSLALINLLPVYPLDGGRALKLILNRIFRADLTDRFFLCLTALIISLLAVYSIYTLNYSLIFITIYILIFSFNNYW